MTQDMNTIYGKDLWNYGAGTLRNCSEGFSHFLRFAAVLLLMVAGVSGVKAQPFTVTTDTDNSGTIDESEKHYYMIQSYVNTAFFMRPNVTSAEVRVNTLNIITDDMKWYFLPVSGESDFYYICDKENRYMFFSKASGSQSDRTWMQLKAFDNNYADKFKFSIAWNSTKSSYNIIPKGNNSSYCLNKQGGNAGGYNSDKKTGDVQIYNGYNDEGACWNFVAVTDYEWSLLPECFQVSTDETIRYYRIQNKNFSAYYIKPGTNYVGTSNSTNEDDLNDMVWYFKEAGSNGFMKYYYIIHANTGKYLRYWSDAGGDSNATGLAEHTGNETVDEENRFKFLVVRGTNSDETVAENKGITFNIVPKLLENAFTDDPYKYYCLTSTNTAGSNLNTANMRSDNKGHWNFVTATYTNVWADPVVTCDLDGNITITNGEEADGASFYYTIDGTTTPTGTVSETNFLYSETPAKPTVSTGITTIKVRAIASGKSPSNVVTKTIVYNPDITLTANSYTYSGLAQNPVSSVSVGETSIASTEYIVKYKQEGDDTELTEATNAGTYTILLKDVDDGDYIVYGKNQTFTIGKAQLTATVDNKEVTYGDVIPTYTANYTGYVNGETDPGFTTQPTFSCDYTVLSDVNTYSITVSGGEANNYEIASCNAGTLTVNPKEVGITWNTPASFDYDGNSHAPTATATGTVNSDVISVTVSPSAKEGSSLTGENAVNAGSYTATASGLTGDKATNYTLPTARTQDFTISKVALTVTAKNNTITYGDAPAAYGDTPADGVTYSGFVNSESETVLSGTLDYEYSYAQYGDVGNTYTITPKGLDATNYTITYETGTLTVIQKEVGLEWPNTSLQYSGTAQVPEAIATGIVNDDEIAVTVEGAETNMGTGYTATASALTGEKAGNYILPAAKTTTFEIIARTLTITAKSKTITYGDVPDNDGVTYEGFITGESETTDGLFTGTLAYEYNYSQYGDVGSYTITPSGLSATNYTISYETGTLTVSPKEVVLTWSETTTFPYDGSEHAPTASATGTVNSEEIGVTVTGGQTNAGTDYTATASALTGEKAGNYILPEENTTTFSITAKALTVKAKDKTITYGDEPANDGVEYSGFIEGEDENTGGMFTEALAYEYNYSQYGDVGSYTITPKDLTATNYTITFDTGTLTVEKKEVGITWSTPTSFDYDGQPHVLTATATDLVNDDVIEVSVTPSAEDESSLTEGGDAVNAGSYTATVSELTGEKAGNYALPSEGLSSAFTIVPAELTEVTLSEISSTYNGATQSITISSVKAGELDLSESDYTVSYSYKQNADDTSETEVTASEIKNAGYYTVTVSPSTTNGNFSGSSTANFTINPLSLGDGTTPATDVDITMDESNNVTVKIGETTLTKYDSEHTNGDYSTESNTDSDGNVVVTITGINNYSGSAQVMRLNLDFYDTGISSTEDNVKDVAPFQASTDMKTTGKDAYIVTSVNMARHEVGLTKLDYAPGSVPVLLLTDLEGTPSDETQPIENSFTASPIHIETGDEADVSANILKMVSEEGGKEVGFGTVFMFYKGRFVLTSGGTLPAGSFYFDNPTPPSSTTAGVRLNIVINGTTDIDQAQFDNNTSESDDIWYTIDGRQFSGKPTKKGLYIKRPADGKNASVTVIK